MKAEEKNSVGVPFSGFFMSLFSGFLFRWDYKKLAILFFKEEFKDYGIFLLKEEFK